MLGGTIIMLCLGFTGEDLRLQRMSSFRPQDRLDVHLYEIFLVSLGELQEIAQNSQDTFRHMGSSSLQAGASTLSATSADTARSSG